MNLDNTLTLQHFMCIHVKVLCYSLQNECDQSYSLYSHIILLIQGHRHYAVLSKQMHFIRQHLSTTWSY